MFDLICLGVSTLAANVGVKDVLHYGLLCACGAVVAVTVCVCLDPFPKIKDAHTEEYTEFLAGIARKCLDSKALPEFRLILPGKFCIPTSRFMQDLTVAVSSLQENVITTVGKSIYKANPTVISEVLRNSSYKDVNDILSNLLDDAIIIVPAVDISWVVCFVFAVTVSIFLIVVFSPVEEEQILSPIHEDSAFSSSFVSATAPVVLDNSLVNLPISGALVSEAAPDFLVPLPPNIVEHVAYLLLIA